MPVTKTLRIVISGRVQGVGFRDFTRKKSAEFSITGYVQNISDGTVHIIATGNMSKLQDFTEALWKGPLLSKVSDIQTSEEDLKSFIDFKIIF